MLSSKNTTLTTKRTRTPFTPQEDEMVRMLTAIYGTKKWTIVASFIKGRTPKQCRDRYSNYLQPGFFKCEWTPEEDILIEDLYFQYGSKWSVISKSFPGRSPNSIKNRWKYFLCKQHPSLREYETNEGSDESDEINETPTNTSVDDAISSSTDIGDFSTDENLEKDVEEKSIIASDDVIDIKLGNKQNQIDNQVDFINEDSIENQLLIEEDICNEADVFGFQWGF